MDRIKGTVTFVYIPTWPRAPIPSGAFITDDKGRKYHASTIEFDEPPVEGQRVSFNAVKNEYLSYKWEAKAIFISK